MLGAGYLAHGTATDYMFDRLKVPLSLTWEIYGDNDAHFNDCFRMFNPTTREKFDEVGTSSQQSQRFISFRVAQQSLTVCSPSLPCRKRFAEGSRVLQIIGSFVPCRRSIMNSDTSNKCICNITSWQCLMQVVANWSNAIFMLLELLPGHPAIPKPRALGRKVCFTHLPTLLLRCSQNPTSYMSEE